MRPWKVRILLVTLASSACTTDALSVPTTPPPDVTASTKPEVAPSTNSDTTPSTNPIPIPVLTWSWAASEEALGGVGTQSIEDVIAGGSGLVAVGSGGSAENPDAAVSTALTA